MAAETLGSLYKRASHGFVYHDFALTHCLIKSAFDILHPPANYPEPLANLRRKWDVLRITFETLVYTSPQRYAQPGLSDELKQILLEPPSALLKTMYTRSTTLFTPTDVRSSPSPAYLPGQVLIVLVLSSIKMNCFDSGRYFIEEWLARRDPLSLPDSMLSGREPEGDMYEKVLEKYCLDVLPNLDQWDYAREFLEHETELPDSTRQKLKKSLSSLYTRELAARKTPQPQPRRFTYASPSTSSSNRPASPTPSSSSSLSTASAHTITPSRGRHKLNGLSSISTLPSASASTTSLSSDTTATPQGYPTSRKPQYTNGHGSHQKQPNGSLFSNKPPDGTNRSSSSSSHPSSSNSPWSSIPFVSHSQTASFDPSNPSLYALIKTTLSSYFTLPKVSTILIIFVLFPVISFALRLRHKRRKLLAGGGGALGPSNGGRSTPLGANASSNADLVRKRLQIMGIGGDGSLLQRLWVEVARMVMDTVKMAGSGLV